ncbi:hypothetical protein CXB51_014402 [Gossypium anomalum]|uniref:Uncharacterized protein n=1 Tax=Gossypium anomalum TaxID=47600 RepID=A0A8J6D4T7_9ROSI|nr:hypothetical protein CXB51_014402 [Gossypium anomalum]
MLFPFVSQLRRLGSFCKSSMKGMFENLKMNKEENLSEFYVRLRDIYNEAYCLDEHFLRQHWCENFLRSLSKRVTIKVTVIKKIRRDKLRLEKNIAFNVQQAIQTTKKNEVVNEINKQIALLFKNLNKALKKF